MADNGKRVYLPTETDRILTETAKARGLKKSQLIQRALYVYRALPAVEIARLLDSTPTPQQGG